TPFKLFCFYSNTVTSSQSFSKGTDAPAVATRIAYRGGGGVERSAGRSNSSTRDHRLPDASTTVRDSIVVGVLAEGTTSTTLTHSMPDPWAERIDYASDDDIGR